MKFRRLHLARCLASVAVVGYHAHGIALQRGHDYPISYFYELCGYAPVEFLFVLSGFIIAYAHYRDIGKPGAAALFAKKRFARVFPVYWCLFPLLLAGPLWLRPLVTTDGKVSGAPLVASFLLFPQPGVPLLGVAWTLPYEMLFYVFCGICLWRPGTRVFAFSLLFFMGLAGSIMEFHTYPWTFLLSVHHLAFVLGALIAVAFRQGWRPASGLTWAWAGFALMVGEIVLLKFGFLPLPPQIPRLFYIVCSGLLIAGLTAQDFVSSIKERWLLWMIGSAAYSIYLLHYPAMVVCARLLDLLGTPGALFSSVLLCLGLLSGIVFYYTVERPLHRIVLNALVSEPDTPVTQAAR